MNIDGRKNFLISKADDTSAAVRCAENCAAALGFAEKDRAEIALVMRELISNIIKHAGQGNIAIGDIAEDSNRGIQLESVDNGPGIGDIERAISDGFSTGGSLGFGLGTINRLMDNFEIASIEQGLAGTRVTCRRWLQKNGVSAKRCSPLTFGAATRPYPGMLLNGDAFVIKRWNEFGLVAVIDGLGHGQFAHRASQKAVEFIEGHYMHSLEDIFRGTARNCYATRGVVMSVARFDLPNEKVSFAGIGNIGVKVFGLNEPVNFMVRRGVIGMKTCHPLITEHPWKPAYTMVLFSDGISTHWGKEEYKTDSGMPAQTVAQNLLGKFAKESDDATVVVVKGNM